MTILEAMFKKDLRHLVDDEEGRFYLKTKGVLEKAILRNKGPHDGPQGPWAVAEQPPAIKRAAPVRLCERLRASPRRLRACTDCSCQEFVASSC